MAGTPTVYPNAVQGFAVSFGNRPLPTEGPLGVGLSFPFGANQSYLLDLANAVTAGNRISQILSLFIDNSASLTQYTTISFPGSVAPPLLIPPRFVGVVNTPSLGTLFEITNPDTSTNFKVLVTAYNVIVPPNVLAPSASEANVTIVAPNPVPVSPQTPDMRYESGGGLIPEYEATLNWTGALAISGWGGDPIYYDLANTGASNIYVKEATCQLCGSLTSGPAGAFIYASMGFRSSGGLTNTIVSWAFWIPNGPVDIPLIVGPPAHGFFLGGPLLSMVFTASSLITAGAEVRFNARGGVT